MAIAWAVERPAPTTKKMEGLRVLVVEDQADSAASMVTLLRMNGHEVRVAFDGPAALVEAQVRQPDVVLLDIGLPDLDGYEVARRIRAGGDRPVRLVALTGWGQAEDKRRAAQAGFDAHWTKPVDPARLHEL